MAIDTNIKYEYLKRYFGYDSFREGQEVLIDSILAGKDTFGVMPTGAGKSICYQLPGIMMDGITLVITPLISLMKDQVASLKEAGIRGAYFNSSLTWGQYLKALEYAKQGTYKIIYVAPERLTNQVFLDFAKSVKIQMVAVDEAHCISQWGQDFRPSYLKIMDFIDELGYRPVISAFTATATSQVKQDIIRILQLRNPTSITTGFDRSNLKFEVKKPPNKYNFLKQYIREHSEQSGIVYCLTRKLVEEVCDRLNDDGISATRYHAGLTDEERRANQDAFTYDEKTVMVATNAFGMGIDKSNVRFVVHYNMPKNMESYYQEAGRAGRDGENADCILLFGEQDIHINQLFIERDSENEEMTPAEREKIRDRDRARLRQMIFYCRTDECLRQYILAYFGEHSDGDCGNCSNCLADFESMDITRTAANIVKCVDSLYIKYGITTIVDILRGSQSEKIHKARLDENPFYGKETHLSKQLLMQIINHLIMHGYLAQSEDRYGVLTVGEKGSSAMLMLETLHMKYTEEKAAPAKKAKAQALQEDINNDYTNNAELYEALRTLRMKLAKTQSVPAFVIFSDKTLHDMCVKRPADAEAMLEVSGVGEAKLERYGKQFLEVIGKYS